MTRRKVVVGPEAIAAAIAADRTEPPFKVRRLVGIFWNSW